MGEVKFTRLQQEAVDIRNKNIIVSAQAGAGKTQVLVSRIINLLEESRIDIRDMLIVTFTNKAAAEMKDRIKESIAEKIQSVEDDELLRYFQVQYTNTNQAQISTMHSFGINVLRKYFYKLGINPKFKLLTDTNLDILKWQSIGEVFDQYYNSNDEDFYRLLKIYSKKYTDDYLKNLLFKIYTFIQSQINPFEWLKSSVSKYEYIDDINEEGIELRKNKFLSFYEDEIKHVIENYQNIIEHINSINVDNLYLSTIQSDIEIFERLKRVTNFDEMEAFIQEASFVRKESISKKFIDSNSIDPELKDEISGLIDEYRSLLKDGIFDSKKEKYKINYKKELEFEDQLRKSLDKIYEVLLNYDKKFSENKNEKNAIDFNDVEHLLIELLQDEEVRLDLQKKYKYIFFDEYQDANQVQNEIVNLLKNGENLFFVGDIKQSIYKFRLADPMIFKNRYENYKSDNQDSVAIDLYDNFRTERNLLKLNNFIFNSIMTDKVGDVEYDTQEHRLNPGKPDSEYFDKKSRVEFNYIHKVDDEITNVINKEDLDINVEAILVQRKIEEILNRGYQYKDIAILSRSKSMFADIIKVFEKNNTPYFYDASGFNFEDIELKLFIEIIKAINNDNDDITLLSAITSTLGNITDEELAEIRYDDRIHSFRYVFDHYKDREDAKISIVEKINYYKSKISEYRELEKISSLEDFLWYVLIDSGYMSYLLSKNNGDKLLSNVRAFINEVSQIENSSFHTLSSLTNYLERIQKRKLTDRESEAELSDKDNVVRIMTMHKSKGLQFKIAIIVDLDKKFNDMDTKESVILNDDMGISLKVYDEEKNTNVNPFSFNEIAEVKKRELYSEEMRVLYVALTRAITEMHFISSSKSEKIAISAIEPESQKSYHEWIYSVVSSDERIKYHIISNTGENVSEMIHFQNELNKKIEGDLNYIHFNKYRMDDLMNEEFDSDSNESSKVKEYSIDENTKNKISEILAFEYNDELKNIPFKKTVTEISSKDKNISPDFKDYEKITIEEEGENTLNITPKFLSSKEEEFDSLKKGSLYHYIFEILPITMMDVIDVEDFLKSLLVKNTISQSEYNIIDKNIIMKFIHSQIFQRLLAAASRDELTRESQFTMIYNENGHDINVDGQIDLFFEEDGELVILDFKTNKIIDENLYKKQLELYKDGLEKATGKRVKEKVIYWVMHGKTSIIN